MSEIAAIVGSLRRGSYNRALLRAAIELSPDGCTIRQVPIDDIPLYNADLQEEQGIPEAVATAKDTVAGADALLLVTPEYNHSMPGVLKNAIDWMSRPSGDAGRVFGGKPVGLIGATTGGWGTKLSQTAWLQVLRALSMEPFFGESMYVSHARDLFDEEGRLTDDDTRGRLREYLVAFHRFIRS
jgi:NAD(P)H-dependent FMN reductase